MDIEDDPIIRELDVYLTDTDLNLFLLQFPLRPVYVDPPDIVSAKFKPVHKKLELEVPLPRSYLQQMDKDHNSNQAMISSTITQKSSLGVALINDGAMHITPITEVLQMRPSFKELKLGHEIIEDLSDDEDDNKQQKEKPALEQIHMKRKENERAQTARMQSFTYINNKEQNETWQKLSTHTIGDNECNESFDVMYYNYENENVEIKVD
jgi:hypothetical protein